jgi:hypothetical protein
MSSRASDYVQEDNFSFYCILGIFGVGKFWRIIELSRGMFNICVLILVDCRIEHKFQEYFKYVQCREKNLHRQYIHVDSKAILQLNTIKTNKDRESTSRSDNARPG